MGVEHALHQPARQALPTRVGARHHAPDASAAARLDQHPQVARRARRVIGPPVLGVRVRVTPVELGVCGALLDHEDVDAQAHQVVQGLRVELVPSRLVYVRWQVAHAGSGTCVSAMPLMQYRWSVGVP